VIGGRYSFDREIGRGGTGAVWLGRDELLVRQVALKRIGLAPGEEHTDVARADREAQLSARLHHPHVVAVFDVVAEADTGEHWLVMEYVDGTTLAELVHAGRRLSADRAASLLGQAADGLLAAHAAGITHRDVKPSNILVAADDHVKLTDFGIARRSADPSLTQTGLVTGSPAYIAPEVASGGRGDEAADVWSLGATAFHVLAGRPPYEAGDHLLAMLYRIVNDEPPRLSEAGWAAALLEGTMVRDPSQRWSMEQVRDFLTTPRRAGPEGTAAAVSRLNVAGGDTQLLTPAGVGISKPPEPEQVPVVSGRHRSALVLGALGLAACVVLAVVLHAVWPDGAVSGAEARASAPSSSSAKAAAAKPTARGMEAFIRDYVRTVADDPDRAWTMLTAKFQRESGGLDHYRSFWGPATDGQVRSISADPSSLSVSYQVHFDDWDNGPGPTVLDLVYADGHYLIDGERTKGFQPAD
jgi:eukaryotic-like serine/threonine-protein kinase